MRFIEIGERIINTRHISFIERDKIWFDDNSYIGICEEDYLKLKHALI